MSKSGQAHLSQICSVVKGKRSFACRIDQLPQKRQRSSRGSATKGVPQDGHEIRYRRLQDPRPGSPVLGKARCDENESRERCRSRRHNIRRIGVRLESHLLNKHGIRDAETPDESLKISKALR